MNIALIGYGKMGQRLHALAKDHNLTVGLVVIGKLNKEGASITPEKFASIDLAIDFSHPDGVMTNIRKLSALKVPIIIGTTGWLTEEHQLEIEALCAENEVQILYGSNFSLGVQLFLKLIEKAATMMGTLPDFRAALHEVHHMDKTDAPSGTAVTAAQLWKKHDSESSSVEYGIPTSSKPSKDVFYTTSQRLPGVVGEHELRIRSPFDDIRISHTALSRDAFASGALKAAHWLIKQNAGFYKIEDVAESVLKLTEP